MDFQAFFKISYGMFVVSSKADGKLNGYISNSVFQVTSEPPQIAVSCNKDNYTAEIIANSGFFSVSVLEENTPSELIGNFGYKCGKDLDKFESVKYQTGETGIPIVTENTIAWFECKLVQTFDVGTHLLFIGEVISSQALAPDTDPLTYAYYRNVKKGVAPKNAPTYIDKSKLDKKEEKVPEAEATQTGGEDKAGGGDKYECLVCGHVYDPAEGDPGGGIPPGTAFEDIPDDWICPVCGTRKTDFTKI